MPKARKAVSPGGRPERAIPGLDDATPERIAQARCHGTADRDGQGVRRIGDPFDTLQARNLLDRHHAQTNALLWQAGDRLRTHWHRSRLDGLTAFDFTRDAVDTSAGQGTTPSESALRHREALRAARDAVGPRLSPFLNGAVIDAQPLAALRVLVTDTGHARTQEALALDRLREALHRLCDLWRLTADTRQRRMGAWRDPTPEPLLTEP